jgi:hypothetical protein
MKKTMLVAFLFTGCLFTVNAQKIPAAKVPAAIMASFAKQFPGITGQWEKEAVKYEVNFKKNGVPMSALLDEKGNIAETEMEIKESDLPAASLAYLKEHYKGKKIKECAKITMANGSVNYEAEVNGKDVIFDANGKFIKEVND